MPPFVSPCESGAAGLELGRRTRPNVPSSPIGAPGIFVYPVASARIVSRPDERRRNPRHTASSIVYVHLGPDNGGIVINLGVDGVACQAARRLAAKKNTIFNVRLRGSGLNAELVGELVWISATQKELGICFKNLSPSVQQGIADWIVRQDQVCKPTALDDPQRPKPMPAMPGISAAGEKAVPRSLSAAFAMSQAVSVDPPSSADAAADESHLPASLDSAKGISDATPVLEIVSPIQDCKVPSDEFDDLQGRNADSSALPVQSQVEQALHDQPLSELSPIEQPHQSPVENSSPIALTEEPMPPVRETLPQASGVPPGKSELCKTEEIAPAPGDPVSRPTGSVPAATAAERWVPPVLLAAWRRGNRQRKFLLASIAATCLLIFALILILAVVHIDSSFGQSAGSGSLQQSTAGPAASSFRVGSPHASPLRAPPVQQVTDQPEPDQPPTSLLESFAETFLGYKPDIPDPETQTRIQIQIDKDHVGVQVWTSKGSGYYYCSDSPYYKMVQPGTLTNQRDALQRGYQPKLGQFCN